jgi:hypothetical protein
MGDRPGSETMSIYFDMRIWVIRDWSGNCQTIQISKNREILKNKLKFLQFFFKISIGNSIGPLTPVHGSNWY